MTKQEKIMLEMGNILRPHVKSKCSMWALVRSLVEYQHSQGVVVKGNSLGVSHPHLANYYLVEPLIEKQGE